MHTSNVIVSMATNLLASCCILLHFRITSADIIGDKPSGANVAAIRVLVAGIKNLKNESIVNRQLLAQL